MCTSCIRLRRSGTQRIAASKWPWRQTVLDMLSLRHGSPGCGPGVLHVPLLPPHMPHLSNCWPGKQASSELKALYP